MNSYLKRKGKILVGRNKILIKESEAKHKTKIISKKLRF